MDKKFDLGRFEYYSYDRFHCVRPSLLLLAAIVFLCRGFIASTITAIVSLGGKSVNLNNLLLVDRHWTTFMAAAPAMVVMCALLARVPNAAGGIRWIWKHGRFLLSVSIVSQIMLLEGFDNPTWKSLSNLPEISLAICCVNILILGYVLFSQRVKDTFADFPAAISGHKN